MTTESDMIRKSMNSLILSKNSEQEPSRSLLEQAVDGYRQVSNFVKDVEDTVSQIREGFGYVQDIINSGVRIVEGYGDATQNISETLKNSLIKPDSNSLGSNFSSTPSNKVDPQQVCGSISLLTNAVGQVGETLSAVAAEFSTSSLSGTIPDWKHVVSLTYNRVMSDSKVYSKYIDDVVSVCKEVYKVLERNRSDPISPITYEFIDEVIKSLEQAQSNAVSSYVVFRDNNIFDQSKWDASETSVQETIELIEENMKTEEGTSSAAEFRGTKDHLKIVDRFNQIKYKLCSLSVGISDNRQAMVKIKNLSKEKPISPFVQNISAFLDRLKCHFNYMIDTLKRMKSENPSVFELKLADLYLQLQEIKGVMSVSDNYLKELIKQSNTGKEIAVTDEELLDTGFSAASFISIAKAFVVEAQSIMANDRSVARLLYLYNRLVELSSEAKSALSIFSSDSDTEYSEVYQESLVVVSNLAKTGISRYSEVLDAFRQGDWVGGLSYFADDLISQRFSTYYNLISKTLLKKTVNKILLNRKSHKVDCDLLSFFVDESKEARGEEVQESKDLLLQHLQTLKEVMGSLEKSTRYKDKLAEVNKAIIEKSSRAREVYAELNSLSDVEVDKCQGIL